MYTAILDQPYDRTLYITYETRKHPPVEMELRWHAGSASLHAWARIRVQHSPYLTLRSWTGTPEAIEEFTSALLAAHLSS